MTHPFCPHCKTEALFLIEVKGEEMCGWCNPAKHLGPPFKPGAWPRLKERLVAK